MENKKQLVIVPPISEPLKKLNEVLDNIANDENIEISIIDDIKELTQFLGSAGQSLVMFSNAKKCASFLQENKFVLAKTHSKVILLTPKEIPAKTLVKFVKLGLTEAILETSPPKTLLYKVKLLLRSIKGSAAQTEEKDQVIKSMIDLTGGATKSDAVTEEEKAAVNSENFNYLEDRKVKKNQEENIIDYGDGLKGEVTPEEAMDTHWKSKRKKDGVLESEETKSERLESSEENIDMYYRGKQKKDTGIAFDESEMHHKKKEIEESLDSQDDSNSSKKLIDDISLDIEKKKSNYVEEDTSPLSVKLKKEFVLDLEKADEPEVRELTDEEKAAQKKKDFDELEALFEAAKKRQAEQVEELGGHYKGKVLNNEEEGEELEAIESKEYDNSDLDEKEKTVELDLIAADVDYNKDKEIETDDSTDPHEGEVDHIETNMIGKTNTPDVIENDNMMSDIGEDSSKKIATYEVDMLDKSKKTNEELSEEDSNKKRLDIESSNDEDFREKNEPDYNKEDNDDRKKDFDLDLLSSSDQNDRDKNSDENDAEDDYLRTKKQAAGLSLVDGDDDSASKSQDDDGLDMSLQKLNQSDLDLDQNTDPHIHEGKVDKIDTYFRSTSKKNPDHNWDNLTGKKSDSFQLEKGAKPNDEKADYNLNRKDAGEITIDYRKLKEEFSSMARGEDNENDEDSIYKKTRGDGLEDDEASSRVIIVNPRGFDFGIGVVNLIYQKEIKAIEFYKKISEEIISQYQGFPIFYTYKSSDNKHSEAFDSIMHFGDSIVSSELKEWWHTYKTQKSQNFDGFYNKSMTTWVCRELEDQKNESGHWEDVELPAWAANELSNKEVELIFPYFDGVDRMGVAVIFFPKGINPKFEKSLLITLELARTAMLDSIQRKIVEAPKNTVDTKEEGSEVPEKKAGLFSNIFNRKKAG